MTNNATEITIDLATEADTEQLGLNLANCLQSPIVIYLHGELGAGKTRLARAILHGLGHTGNVKSPTYTLVEPYDLGHLHVYHFDLYRLADPLELEYMGIRDYFLENTVAMIEWPERGKGILNPADIEIDMRYKQEGRMASVDASTERGVEVLQKLKQSL